MAFLKMENLVLLLSLFIQLMEAATSAESPGEVYWHSVLPETPIPIVIQELLKPRTNDTPNPESGVIVDPFSYIYRNEAADAEPDPGAAIKLFFLEENLYPGSSMELLFDRTLPDRTRFLPRERAEEIPFSTSKLPEILRILSINRNSSLAASVAATLRKCEEPAIAGESKTCATSLEAMVDFVTSNIGALGVALACLTTSVSREGSPVQRYVVGPGVERLTADETEMATCHAQVYAYAVFNCHTMHTWWAYTVPVTGTDGTTAVAVAVCHGDTGKWDANHVAFRVLAVEPGTVPICHFLPQDHLLWVSSST